MKRLTALLSVSLFVVSCTDNASGTEKKAEISVADYDQNIALENDFILPQPITLIEAFSSAGLAYESGRTNPSKNKNGYSLKADQLFNIGIYSTDMAYCILNNRTQEAVDYFEAVRSLGAKSGLESVFSDKEILEKFGKNLDNKEKLTDLVYEVQEKMDVYLHDNDLRHLAAIQFAGAWTEALYLACSQWKQNQKPDDKINTAVADQMNLLENIIVGLKRSPAKDKRIESITSDLEKIHLSYSSFPSVKSAATNKNYGSPKLNKAEFDSISDQISAVRQRIVTGK